MKSAAVSSPASAGEHPGVNPPHLTPRQMEVLILLCEGLPNKLICRRLNIATGTVKVHISGILRELGVTSRLQAVVAARRCGLLGELGNNGPEQGIDSSRGSQYAIAAGANGKSHPRAVVF